MNAGKTVSDQDFYDDFFPEEEKKIFSFFDGTKDVKIDPMEMRRRISMNFRTAPKDLIVRMKSTDSSVALQAVEEFVQSSRMAFNMPWNYQTGEGSSEEMVYAAWNTWVDWNVKKKQSTASTPALQQCQDCP